MTNMPPNLKDEKDEKHHEKEEKGHSDPLSTAVWGAIIVWAGLVLLAENLGMLSTLNLPAFMFPGAIPFRLQAWPLIFAGAGVIILIEVVIRLSVPSYRRHVIGSIILAFVFLGIGLGNLISWGAIWGLVLIAVGVSVLIRSFGWRG